jgi:hypothetical protein
MRIVFACLMTALVSLAPVNAQTLRAEYEVIGQFEGQVDAAPVTFVALQGSSGGSSDVQLFDPERDGLLRIIVRSISDEGTPGSPGFSLTIGPIEGAGPPLTDVFYFGGEGYFVSDVDIGGRVRLQSFEMDAGEMRLSLDAVLTPVARDGHGGVMEDTRRSPIRVTGAFSGMVTSAD